MDNTLLARVQAAAIDGRMRNYRTRQNELMSLYQALVGDMAEFLDAIQVDEECSKAEAQIIMAATLHEVREHYNRFDFKRELDFEYSIKRGKSASRRLPAGIAYIIPDPFTLTFSVFSAVAASIEAGCCCVIEVSLCSPWMASRAPQIDNTLLAREDTTEELWPNQKDHLTSDGQ